MPSSIPKAWAVLSFVVYLPCELPEEERANYIESYHKRLMSDDTSISHPAAIAWNTWEITMSTLYPNEAGLKSLEDPAYLLAHARMESHYFQNNAWLEEGQLLRKENVDKIRHIPCEWGELGRFKDRIADL
jgi:proline iminopeptidase